MKKAQANVKRMTRKHFEKIYKSAEAISKAYHTDGAIPLITIKEILDKAKLKSGGVVVAQFEKEFNKCLTLLYDCCKKQADELNGRLPLLIFRKYIDTLKDNI